MSDKVFDTQTGKRIDKTEPATTEPVDVQIARQNYALFVSINSSLKSINGKLNFFMFLVIVGLAITILNSCGALMGIR